MDTNPHAIEAIGLGRDYGSTRALEALDLTVPAGAIVGLVFILTAAVFDPEQRFVFRKRPDRP